MIELIEWFKNASWWQFLAGIIGLAFVIRFIYEILTDK